MTPEEAAEAQRQAQRRELLSARAALSPEEHARKSREAMSRALAVFDGGRLPALQGRTVGAYVPIRGELDVLPLLEEVLRRGGEVALPVVVGRARPLEFRRRRPGDPMQFGPYDIPYPAAGESVEPDRLHVMLVPLLGFDAACYRLGYGGGYYDRTLAACARRPFTVGIGFELGRLPSIRPLPHDMPLDCIVTEETVLERDVSA